MKQDRSEIPLDERCSYCRVFRYFDVNETGEHSVDGAYICGQCVGRLDGKRQASDKELYRFLNDPDEIHRLEQRVRDLEMIVATFAERAAA